MILVDVHAHLDHCEFCNDLDAVIERAKQSGVVAIINNGLDFSSNKATLSLAKKFSMIKAALGLYPDISKISDIGEYEKTVKHIQENIGKIVAIGEVGLDYSATISDCEKELQKKAFSNLIDMAEKYNKPLIVHTRKAEKDCIELLEKKKAKKVVLHCFTGDMKLAKIAEKNGWCFSIPPIIVRSRHFQELAARIDLSRILTETDAPYLGLQRDARNEPCNVLETIKKIADIKKIDPTEAANAVYMNYQKIF